MEASSKTTVHKSTGLMVRVVTWNTRQITNERIHRPLSVGNILNAFRAHAVTCGCLVHEQMTDFQSDDRPGALWTRRKQR